MSTTPTHCLECNAPLGPSEPHGLCARCLLKMGFASKFGEPSIAGAGQRVPIPPPLLPFDFGPYRVLRLLGRGGMGAVYEGEHLDTGRRVALKVLGQTLDSVEMRKRFLREGRLAASVCHPNTVYIYGTEEIDGVPVIAMELAAGGTLRDLLKKKGPLPVKEAVDAILQVIAGLEAAHDGGVLHRDVKPANCFVTPEGSVKVGDFGLSVSTLARADSQLTASGMMLGTPSYAPPEQLRGDELDVRSDIYSVGATLYTLLTGKAPFEGENAVQVVAAVLDKTPMPISGMRKDVPVPLAHIVSRCLAKKKEDRFASYADLREALLPFSAESPEPAPLGLRFVASIVDEMCSTIPWFIFLLMAGRDLPTLWLSERSPGLWMLMIGYLLARMAYYTVAEGVWGAGIGKALCGLRVVRPGFGAPGFARAAGRISIFMTAECIGYFGQALLTSAAEYRAGVDDEHFMFVDFAWLLFLLLFVTMRPSNGWAAIHDLLTGTRVVQRTKSRGPQRIEAPKTLVQTEGKERVGPFIVLEPLPMAGWFIGYDELLRRHVWIQRMSPGAAWASDARRNINRGTRLRCIAGARKTSESWDAYQAPSGVALTQLQPQSQSWSAVRYWLADVTEEITAAGEEGTLPKPITLDHVWITSEGRAILLDEPVTSSPAGKERRFEVTSPAGLQELLHAIAGRAMDFSEVPLRARSFVLKLASKTFDRASFIAGNLQSLLAKPGELTRRRRLASLIFAPSLCLLICSTATALMVRDWFKTDVSFRRAHAAERQLPDAVRLYAETKGEELSLLKYVGPTGIANAGLADAIGQWTAYRFGDFIRDSEFDEKAKTLRRSERRTARGIVKNYRNVTAEQFAAVDPLVSSAVTQMELYSRVAIWGSALGGVAVFMLGMGIVNVVAVAIFGTSLGLRLFGLAVVDRSGAPASRWRHLARNLIACAPIGLTIGLVYFLKDVPGDAVVRAVVMFGGAGLSLIVAVIFVVTAIRRPSGGWYDRMAGTRVVLR